jgi:hypothetical protein
MRTSGLPVTAVGRDLDIAAVYQGATAPARLPGPDEPEDEARSTFRALLTERAVVRPSRESRLRLYGEVAEAMVDDLLALARSWRPDLVVYDPLTHAGPLVATLLGVPAVRSLFGPDVTYFLNGATEAPGWLALLDRFGVSDVDLLGAASVDPCPPSLQYPATVAPTRRIHTRYIPYNGIAEVPALPTPDPGRTRICLTWGTSVARLLGDHAFLPGEVLDGAAKLAQERDADLVLAITANQRHLLPDLPPHVHLHENVPLHALLPTCHALIHQGGAGTLLTGLLNGLPQIILTQLVDQTANAIQLVHTGAGLNLPATNLTATDLLTAGHDLLDNPTYRQAAQHLQHEITTQPTPNHIIDTLQELAGVA